MIQTLSLRQNLIKKIENLDGLKSLQELDLYDNQIRKLENLQNLTELEWVWHELYSLNPLHIPSQQVHIGFIVDIAYS